MTLSAIRLLKPAGPSCSASYTVAIPPSAILRMSRKLPWYSSRCSFFLTLSVVCCTVLSPFQPLASVRDGARSQGHHDHRRRADRTLCPLLCRDAESERADRRRP